MKKIAMVLLVSVFTALPVWGGPLRLTQVSGLANWVVHLDCERFNNTRIGQHIREELKAQGVEEKLRNFAVVFGFHPLTDVRDVTLYGKGKSPNRAVMLIDGDFDTGT